MGVVRRRPERDLMYVGGGLALLVALFVLRTTMMREGTGYYEWGVDHRFYRAMAIQRLGTMHQPPYASRILVPIILVKPLTALAPWGVQTAFIAQAAIFLWGAGVVSYLVLREVLADRAWAMAGVLFWISLGWVTKANIMDFWLSDPAIFFFTSLAVLCCLRQRLLAFVACIIVGTLAKETMLFVVPLYASINWGKMQRKTLLGQTFMAGALGVLTFALSAHFFRVIEPTPSPIFRVPFYSLQTEFMIVARDRVLILLQDPLPLLVAVTVMPFSGLLPLAFAGGREGTEWLVRTFPLIDLTYAGLLIAHDTERVLVSAALPITLLVCLGARRISQFGTGGIVPFTAAVAPWTCYFLAEKTFLWGYPFQVLFTLTVGSGILGAVAIWARVGSRFDPWFASKLTSSDVRQGSIQNQRNEA